MLTVRSERISVLFSLVFKKKCGLAQGNRHYFPLPPCLGSHRNSKNVPNWISFFGSQTDLVEELPHLGDPAAGAPLEAVEVLPGEEEVPLLPPGEDPVSLGPEEALADHGGGGGGGGRRGGQEGGGPQRLLLLLLLLLHAGGCGRRRRRRCDAGL